MICNKFCTGTYALSEWWPLKSVWSLVSDQKFGLGIISYLKHCFQYLESFEEKFPENLSGLWALKRLSLNRRQGGCSLDSVNVLHGSFIFGDELLTNVCAPQFPLAQRYSGATAFCRWVDSTARHKSASELNIENQTILTSREARAQISATILHGIVVSQT